MVTYLFIWNNHCIDIPRLRNRWTGHSSISITGDFHVFDYNTHYEAFKQIKRSNQIAMTINAECPELDPRIFTTPVDYASFFPYPRSENIQPYPPPRSQYRYWQEHILATIKKHYVPDHILTYTGIRLDTLAMLKEYAQLKFATKNLAYRLYEQSFYNCSDIVARILRAGTEKHLIPHRYPWSPLQIKRLALNLDFQPMTWSNFLESLVQQNILSSDQYDIFMQCKKRSVLRGSSQALSQYGHFTPRMFRKRGNTPEISPSNPKNIDRHDTNPMIYERFDLFNSLTAAPFEEYLQSFYATQYSHYRTHFYPARYLRS